LFGLERIAQLPTDLYQHGEPVEASQEMSPVDLVAENLLDKTTAHVHATPNNGHNGHAGPWSQPVAPARRRPR
jgi:hypothetical protein